MNYHEATQIIDEIGEYASADYYRMQTAESIALGLRDHPTAILTDVVNHFTPASKELFDYALEHGHIEGQPTPEGYVIYDVVDHDRSMAPHYFRSHIAMQIAYPELYNDYFEGEHVWHYSHPKMQQLLDLNISCLTNKRHPSDYWGQHYIDEDTPKKAGRPKAAPKEKKDNSAWKRWMDACSDYNTRVSKLWSDYLEACDYRNKAIAEAKTWRDNELDRLREEMKAVGEQYKNRVDYLDEHIATYKTAHAQLKAQGKPQLADFE